MINIKIKNVGYDYGTYTRVMGDYVTENKINPRELQVCFDKGDEFALDFCSRHPHIKVTTEKVEPKDLAVVFIFGIWEGKDDELKELADFYHNNGVTVVIDERDKTLKGKKKETEE